MKQRGENLFLHYIHVHVSDKAGKWFAHWEAVKKLINSTLKFTDIVAEACLQKFAKFRHEEKIEDVVLQVLNHYMDCLRYWYFGIH